MATPTPSLAQTSSSELLRRFDGASGPEIRLGLTRVKTVLERLGNPQDALPPVIHIAGTNGKGSVSAYLRALLEGTNARVHVFNSPHLVTLNDGILIGGKPINEDRLANALLTVAQHDPERHLTSFEALTLAAVDAMRSEPADFVILEAGLGGRDDSTNVVSAPAATVLTPIGMDHQEFLGDTVREIASHKIGILRAGVPVIAAPQTDEVADLIEAEADRLGAPLSLFNRDWSVFEQHGRLVFQDDQGLLDLDLPPLHGRFQIENAGTALMTFRTVCRDGGNDPAVLDQALKTAKWPGRLQRLTSGPLLETFEPPTEVWVDGGHNGHAAKALSQALADMDDRTPLPTHLILGMRSNKDLSAFLTPFAGLVRSIQAVPLPDTDHRPCAAGCGCSRIGTRICRRSRPVDREGLVEPHQRCRPTKTHFDLRVLVARRTSACRSLLRRLRDERPPLPAIDARNPTADLRRGLVRFSGPRRFFKTIGARCF